MPNGTWRIARFRSDELRTEFIVHALALRIDGLEVEPVEGDLEVRFRAPAEVEVGIANMIVAHDGKLVPTQQVDLQPARV